MKKTVSTTLIIFLLVFSLVSCSNGELEDLKGKNSELQDEVTSLAQEKSNLIQQLSVKDNTVANLEKNSNENSNGDKYLFDPYTIIIGEKVLGLEISNIKIERTSMNVNYFVDFKGELELSGYFLSFLALAVISFFTGEIVTFVMLGIILISLVNINTNLKTVINKLDKFKEKVIDEDIS